MQKFQFKILDPKRKLRILCLGAHCDDIDIGCGGGLLTLLTRYRAEVTWAVFSATPEREKELRASAQRFLRQAAAKSVMSWRFRDGFFPAYYADIKEAFESLKKLPPPDVIFTHQRADLHQDHRIVAELTWNTFRSDLILEYEVAKYEGGLTTPNTYISLSSAQVERKVKILLDSYVTQRVKKWFTADTFRGLMRLRGIESGSESGWAEGFHVSKLSLE
jgi:LmbE family N-acetylglucosaminyl deacetylase